MTRESYLNDTVTLSLPRCVAFLAVAMADKLKEPQNMAKGGWMHETPGVLLERIHEELRELSQEFGKPTWEFGPIVSEAADVANFAMMLSHCMGAAFSSSWQVPAEYARKPFDLAPTELIGRDSGAL